ncbi:MAG: hypothetical protein Q4C96_10435 [Planctomycetia bacterium]|nr:hypothetical protein [Planctomycetia bacterium]
MNFIIRLLNEESGALALEWIFVIAILVVGIVGGLACVRDTGIFALGNVGAAFLSIDQSFGDTAKPANDPVANPYGMYKDTTKTVKLEVSDQNISLLP